MPAIKESGSLLEEETYSGPTEAESPIEDELKGADLTMESAAREVKDFTDSGLPRAEKIASDMGKEVPAEIKTALVELDREAKLAREMLVGSFIGRLRLKSAGYLKKYLPHSELTALAERKNAEIVSKKTAAELEKLLEYSNGDYEQADQAAVYFAKHKDLLIGVDEWRLKVRVLEAVKIHEQKKAGLLSEKTIKELEALLAHDHTDGNKVEETVNYFLQHKELIRIDERTYIEERIFRKVENRFSVIAEGSTVGSWEDALAEYKKIPAEFLKNKNISRIGNKIYLQAKKDLPESKEMLAAFAGHLELLSAGFQFAGYKYNFSSEDRVRIVSEIYGKLGPSEYISQYNLSDFEYEDRNKVLKPLFESYVTYQPDRILDNLATMKGLFNELPLEKRNEIIKTFIKVDPLGVFEKFNGLSLNQEQIKLLAEKLKRPDAYAYILSEEGLKKLNINKEEIFDELLMTDSPNLFLHRGIFNPTTEQYNLLLEHVTSSVKALRETLELIRYNYSANRLTEEELKVFETSVEKTAPALIFEYKNIFKGKYKEKLEWFLKELPKNMDAHETEAFIFHVQQDLGGWDANIERVRALVAESGEQKVTREYLEQLERTELKLPKRVKEKIKENITKAEHANLLDYFRQALAKNSTLEQLQRDIQHKCEQVTTNSDFFKAVHADVLRKVLTDRRFKTQFETHTSNGRLDPAFRASQESKMFSYADDIQKGKRVRPNYGYLSDNEHGIVGGFNERSVSSNLRQYGHIHVKFKNNQVKDRTTVTFSDSLTKADQLPPTPATKPHFTSLELGADVGRMEHSSKPNDWGSSYLEVQYHWPLRTSLIDSIHISEKNNLNKEEIREVKEMLAEYNKKNPADKIKVVVY